MKLIITFFLFLMITGCVSSNRMTKTALSKIPVLQIDTIAINKKIEILNRQIDSLKSRIDSINTREIK